VQERYLGDSHDFIKYALLRHLNARLGVRLGVNWYLTHPHHVDRADSNDGEKRHHLTGKGWAETDPDLFAKIARFDAPESRNLSNIAAWEILPGNTLYHDAVLSAVDREPWHVAAVEGLAKSDLVFLDPDNGFEIKSMTKRTAPKYAFYKEAADYLQTGKTVVGIQFARQCDPVARAREVRQTLSDVCGGGMALPVIRGRLAPNLLFLTVAPEDQCQRVSQALMSFSSQCTKAEIVD